MKKQSLSFFSNSAPYSLTALLIIFLFFNSAIDAQVYNYENTWGTSGFSLISSNSASASINFSISNWELSDITFDNISMKTITLPGIYLPNVVGSPNLPCAGRYIAIPHGASVTYSIIGVRTESIQNVDVLIQMEKEFHKFMYCIFTKKGNSCYAAQKTSLA
jgi:hypothetical protein